MCEILYISPYYWTLVSRVVKDDQIRDYSSNTSILPHCYIKTPVWFLRYIFDLASQIMHVVLLKATGPETSGVFGPVAFNNTTCMIWLAKSKMYLRNQTQGHTYSKKISVAVQRGNAASVMGVLV